MTPDELDLGQTVLPSQLDLGQTVRGFVSGLKLFSRYQLVRILGRGGMGVVWLAKDEELERDVALKFLPEIILHDPSAIADLKRETRQSFELTHPHIVRTYDFVQDGQTACIAMEYIEGDTLSKLRTEKANQIVETEDLRGYVYQMCAALDYAHTRAKIVHRDLKPSNLMVNAAGDLKIADFGIARTLTDSVSMISKARGVSGTLVYMSPQQLDGERASHLDDIYSVGATVYELLTSKPPFYRGQIDRQIHEKIPPSIAARRAELNTGQAQPISQAWERMVAACLAKDPKQRPQSAGEIARELGMLGSGYALPGTTVRPSAKAAAPKGRQKGIFIAGVVALLVVACFFVWQMRFRPPKDLSTSAPAPSATVSLPPVHVAPSKPVPAPPDSTALVAEGRKAALRSDYDKAAELFQKAADSGSRDGQIELASLYENGNGVPKSYTQAASYYLRAAGQGDITAQNALSLLPFKGDKPYQQQLPEVCRKLVEQKNIAAIAELGSAYLKGEGVAEDQNKGFTMIEQAAQQGYARAQCELGAAYQHGRAVTQNFTSALKLYSESFDAGYFPGACYIGALYDGGQGVQQDSAKAAEFYQKAANHGYPPAIYNLGVAYRDGKGVPQDYAKAVEFFQKAADGGMDVAAFNLGVLYGTGKGVPANPRLAFDFYKRAADHGFSMAQHNLGVLYRDGSGVTRDYRKAAELFQKSADQGLAAAELNLGVAYERGQGVAQSRQKAVELYQRAADHGDSTAVKNLKNLGVKY